MPGPLLPDDIEELLKTKTETKNLDYKQGLDWDSCQKDSRVELIKDILAMANVRDGGRILFGVRDSDFEFIGLSDEQFASFDQTKVNDFLHKYVDPKFSCQVYKHIVREKRVVVIDVLEFPEVPLICKLDANSSKDGSKLILRKGQMYIRTEKGSSEAISSAQEMRELLGRALAKIGDELLANIERLISGRPARESEDSREKYREEIDDASRYIDKSIGEELQKYGSWKVCVYPSEYRAKRIADHSAIRELVQHSQVNLRGWSFPHTDSEGNATNFQKGSQSHTIWNRYAEAYRAYQSGLFVWSRAFWEDMEGRQFEGRPVLSFVSAIWSLTEFLLFAKRYYEETLPNGDLHLGVSLNRTGGRRLGAFHPGVDLWQAYVSSEETILLEDDFQVVNVRASYEEIANQLARRLFALFNWNDASKQMIGHWQTKFLERRA